MVQCACGAPEGVEESPKSRRPAPVQVGPVVLGEGLPKIFVSIMAKNPAELEAETAHYRSADFDVLEWRADFLTAYAIHAPEGVLANLTVDGLELLSRLIPEKPVLFTLRTRREGGAADADDHQYAAALRAALKGGAAMVDLEMSRPVELLSDLIDEAHAAGVPVVLSSHDFAKTAPREALVEMLTDMARLGADVAKVAQTPQSKEDVITLLEATREAADTLPVPVITMSMGPLGVLSRASGTLFGSAGTFGAVKTASAPGQIPCGELRRMLSRLSGM